MAGVVYTLLLLTVALASVEAEWCWKDDDVYFKTWCLHGCCGITRNECCPELDEDYYELSGGAIAGMVILSIFALAMVVGGILLVMFFFTTCCRQITSTRPPGVVYSNGALNPAVVASTNINMASHPTHQTTVSTAYQYPQH